MEGIDVYYRYNCERVTDLCRKGEEAYLAQYAPERESFKTAMDVTARLRGMTVAQLKKDRDFLVDIPRFFRCSILSMCILCANENFIAVAVRFIKIGVVIVRLHSPAIEDYLYLLHCTQEPYHVHSPSLAQIFTDHLPLDWELLYEYLAEEDSE